MFNTENYIQMFKKVMKDGKVREPCLVLLPAEQRPLCCLLCCLGLYNVHLDLGGLQTHASLDIRCGEISSEEIS